MKVKSGFWISGGGSGRFALQLKKLKNDILIIDKNQQAVMIAQERGIEAVCMDIFDFSSSQTFDVVLAIESLDYIYDKEKFFFLVNDLLKPNGRVIFTVTNPHSWRYIAGSFIRDRSGWHHKQLKVILEILKKQGFSLKRIKGFMWIPCKLSSNSRLVYLFSCVERLLCLNRWIKQSPWILLCAEKRQR